MTNNSYLNSLENKLSLPERESLIAKHPIFCLVNSNDIHKLAALAEEVSVPADSIIVEQGSIVDSFILIVSGVAKVTRQLVRVDKNEVINIVTLTEGDAIGLADASFFSQNGIRTATVTAATPMTLLKFDLRKFQDFLDQPDMTYPGLKKMNERFVLMSVIEKMHIFDLLTAEQIKSLTENIYKISVSKDTILFNQGDLADKCYFILSGKVAITAIDNTGREQVLAIIEAFNIFGEGAFIDGGKRNASARAETNCHLLILERDKLNILEQNIPIEKSINATRIQQIRPHLNDHVFIEQTFSPDRDKIILLNNSQEKKQIRLTLMEGEILPYIDGNNTLKDIVVKVNENINHISIYDAYKIILKMKKLGFVQFESVENREARNSWFKQLLNKLPRLK